MHTIDKARFTSEVYRQHAAFWEKQVYSDPSGFIFRLHPAAKERKRYVCNYTFSPGAHCHLAAMAQGNPMAVFTIVSSMFAIALSRYSRQQHVLIHTPLLKSNRLEQSANSFLPLSFVVRESSLVREHLNESKAMAQDCYRFQEYPLSMVSGADPGLYRSNVLMMDSTLHDHSLDRSDYDLVIVIQGLETTNIAINCNEGALSSGFAENIGAHLEQLILELKKMDTRVHDLKMLTPADVELVRSFNQTDLRFNEGILLHQLLERVAAENPHQVALVCENRKMNYRELNYQVNRMAHYLRDDLRVARQEPIGLLMKRSENLVIALLSILKAGGCYVPIDRGSPDARIRRIVEEVGMRVCISDEVSEVTDPSLSQQIVRFPTTAELAQHSIDDPPIVNLPGDLAYIIYTSGSTGKPKGVMIEHRSVVNLTDGLIKTHMLQSSWKYVLTSAIAFDASVKQIFIPIILGAEMHVFVPHGDMSALCSYVDREQINTLHLTPSLWRELLELSTGISTSLSTLEYISSGGEHLTESLGARLQEKFRGKKVWNLYGPTETCINAIGGKLSADVKTPTLGKPLPNTQVYIVDHCDRLSAPGVWGEIVIGGKGVARGYLKNREKTEQVFIPDRFSNAGLLYKTGDLGMWLPNGEVLFGGRLDNQVKRRGVRIELGELEQVMLENSSIDWAFVSALQQGETLALVAYYHSKHPIEEALLKKHMLLSIPTSMLPDYFVFTDSVPVTQNGKIDVDKLPITLQSFAGNAKLPSTATEAKLFAFWRKLLHKSHLSTRDDFFSLGGHSLKAMRLASFIAREWNVVVSLEKIFLNPTIELLAALIGEGSRAKPNDIAPLGVQECYELSAGQRRLWITHYLENAAAAYNMVGVYRCTGFLDMTKLRLAFTALVERHENLRSFFVKVEDEPRVRVLPADNCTISFEVTELAGFENADFEAHKIIDRESNTPFDLEKGPLVRMQLIVLSGNDYVILFNIHHIISDGWSNEILVRDLVAIYNAKVTETPVDLPKLNVQYKDYAAWLATFRSSDEMMLQRKFWLEEFAEPYHKFRLFADRATVNTRAYKGASAQAQMGKQILSLVKAFSTRNHVTEFTVLLSGVYLLLSRYSSQRDIVIGTPVSGRQHPDLENQVGFFLNYLPLRLNLSGEHSFTSLVLAVNERVRLALANQMFPYDELIAELGVNGEIDRSSLFNVAVVMQQQALESDSSLQMEGIQLTPEDVKSDTSLLDLKIDFRMNAAALQVEVNYNADSFDAGRIQGFLVHLRNLLQCCLQNESFPLASMDFLSAEERRQQLFGFNEKRTLIPPRLKFHQFVEIWAEKQPASVALIYNELEMTYSELNEKANVVASWIQERNAVSHGDIIGVMLERSCELVTVILGILKAGCAYLPIDPAAPLYRKKYLIADAGVKLLITRENARDDLRGDHSIASQVALQDVANICALYPAYKNNPPDKGSLHDLAYVIYTSGSTGNPKGVMVKHESIVSMLADQVSLFNISQGDRLLQFAPITFDASVYEMGIAFCGGATLVLIGPEVIQDKDHFVSYIKEKNVTWTVLPPSYLNLLEVTALSSLRVMITAGEPPDTKVVADCLKYFRYFNAYGPTECSVCVTNYEVTEADLIRNTIPIGYPTSNVSLYVVDEECNLLPVGAIGELCVGGVGVASGYIGKDALTAEKFIASPFNTGERLYKTGDLVRWLDNGALEFIGRKDTQVKVRGMRIELGEIEHALLRHSDVKSALVLVRDDDVREKQIIAYVASTASMLEHHLHGFLSGILPAYMLPSAYVILQAFPLTPHGKIDRRKLPAPGTNRQERVPALADPIERDLTKLMADVLSRSDVHAGDNFFLKGGDSLKAIKFLTRIHRDFEVKIPYSDLFANATISNLASLIRKGRHEEFQHIEAVEQGADYPASFAQTSLWLQEQITENSGINVITIAYAFSGRFDQHAFSKSLDQLIQRHEILRTAFVFRNNELRQTVRPFRSGMVKVSDCRIDHIDDKEELNWLIAREASTRFDLGSDLLVRIQLADIGPSLKAFILTMHHMITDEWSMKIFAKELLDRYYENVAGLESSPSSLRLQYRDFAVWQATQWRKGLFNEAERYWLKQFETQVALLNLPIDHPRPLRPSVAGGEYTFVIPEHIAGRIKEITARNSASLFITMLATVKAFVQRITSEQDIVVGTPVSGRTHSDLEDQIGFYVNLLALRSQVVDSEDFESLLHKVKRTVFDALQYQHYPFDQLVKRLGRHSEAGRTPLFDVMVVFQDGQASSGNDVALAGLAIRPMELPSSFSKYDLTFGFTDDGSNGLICHLLYKKALFKSETIERTSENYLAFLDSLVTHTHTPLRSLNVVSESERKHILHKFNAPICNGQLVATVDTILEKAVAAFPLRRALRFGEADYTYRDLDERSDQLARFLDSTFRVGAGTRVAIVGNSSDWFVISMLAIVKTGAAYVPVDRKQPKARVLQILADAEVSAVLSDEPAPAEFAPFNPVNVKEAWADIAQCRGAALLGREAKAEDPVYVIYTSGTTGVPKGVVVSHKALINLCLWHQQHFGVRESSRATQFASVSFDAAAWEIWPYLLAGAAVYPVPEEIKIESTLKDLLIQNEITHCFLPTRLYEQMDFTGLDYLTVLTGGEQLKAVNQTHQKVYNNYGPTECTVVATSGAVERGVDDASITIGKPILNTHAYVVNHALQLQPIGVEGELCLAGTGLASGYLNRAALSQEKFVDNPFEPGTKLYRTGDIVKWRDNGEINFIGRKDLQVKIRGFRIELPEIEHALSRHPKIRDCVVLLRGDDESGKELIAFYRSEETLAREEACVFLETLVPHYMIPHHFVCVQQWPFTVTGKIDAARLLDLPAVSTKNDVKENVDLATESERVVAESFRIVLNPEKISSRSNFFDLGGDSIKAIQIAAWLKKSGYKVSVKDIFQHPILSRLAHHIGKTTESAERGPVGGIVQLTPIQRAFFESDHTYANHFNQAVMWFSPGRLDGTILERVFEVLMLQHDMLRATYNYEDDRVVQSIPTSVLDCFKEYTVLENIEQEAQLIQQSIDLKAGPPMRAALFHADDGDRLLMVIHHLVVDGVSWRILFEDITNLYYGMENGREMPTLIRTDSFQKWADRLMVHASSEALMKEKSHWRNIEQQAHKSIRSDFEAGAGIISTAGTHSINLSQAESTDLLTSTNTAFNTEINDILIAALSLAVRDVFGLEMFRFDMEGHGREEIFEDIDITRTVGWFTSIHPVVIATLHAADLSMHIKFVKECLRKTPSNGIGYGILKHLTPASLKTDLSFDKTSDVLFNYLGQFDQDIKRTSFTFAKESVGSSIHSLRVRKHAIEVNGLVIGGELHLSVTYNMNQFKSSTIERLLGSYKTSLVQIIEHCRNHHLRELTPSDFAYKDLSITDLDSLNSIF